MKVLFMVNIPAPYRVEFFNELGKSCDLTVTFEGTSATDRDEKWATARAKTFTPVFLKGVRTGAAMFLSPGILRVLRKKWDAIIVGDYSTPTGILAIEYLRMTGKPFYVEADGGFISADGGVKYAVKRHLLSGAIGWFSSGAATTDYFVHYGAAKERCYRYPFSSLSERDLAAAGEGSARQAQREAAREKLGVRERVMLLAVGRAIPVKGFDVLLDAAPQLPEDVGVYIVGGDPPEAYRKKKEDLALDNVHFIGFQTKEDLKDYYLAADLFVLPTRGDVWGLVVNEAMANALPVVTTDQCVAGLELVREGENGAISRAGDAESLAAALCRVLDADYRAYGAKSREIIAEYTIEGMARAHMEVLERNA